MKFTGDDVFYTGGTAALFVMSPFQLLCAREAVEEFKFDEYRYVFLLSPNTAKRNEQMIQMAKEWDIEFDLYDSSQIVLCDFLAEKCIFNYGGGINKYDRIFSGDYWSPECRMLAKIYAKKNAVVSFVDDGTASVYVLNGQFCCGVQSESWTDIFRWYHLRHSTHGILSKIDKNLRKHNIYVTDSMFSVYSDVTPSRFLTRKNSFKRLLSESVQVSDSEEVVYFIGSPSDDFCTMFGISIDYLNEIIYSQLSEVRQRFAGNKIVYIPHPRDTNPRITSYCCNLGIEFLSLNYPAEDYIRNRNKRVVAIYGFGSSALINLKRMFQNIQVVNIVIENSRQLRANRMRDVIHKYYKQNGIETIRVIIPDEKNMIQPISLKQNIIGLFNYFTKGFLKR